MDGMDEKLISLFERLGISTETAIASLSAIDSKYPGSKIFRMTHLIILIYFYHTQKQASEALMINCEKIFRRIGIIIAAISLSYFVVAIGLCNSVVLAGQTCTVDEAYDRLYSFYLKTSADEANTSSDIMKQINSLSSNAKNEQLPVGAQLSPENLAELEKLTTRLQYLRAKSLFDSNLVRDSDIFIALSKLSDKLSRNEIISDSDDDRQYMQLYALILFSMPDTKLAAITKYKECSVSAGLQQTQIKVYLTIDSKKTVSLNYRISKISEKHNVQQQDGWIDKLPDGEDKKEARDINAELLRQAELWNHIQFIQNLIILQNFSIYQHNELIHALNKAKNRAEMNSVADVYDIVARSDGERSLNASRIIQYIIAHFPSDEAKMNASLNQILKDQGHIPNH